LPPRPRTRTRSTRKGFKYATIDVVYSPFTAATAAYASVCKVQESDASGSGQADVTGLAITAGAGATTGRSVGAVARFNVDLRGRKRYLTVVTSPGNTVAIVTNGPAEQGRAARCHRHRDWRGQRRQPLTLDTTGTTPTCGRLGCCPAARWRFWSTHESSHRQRRARSQR
jgi:hypothetical protein